VIAELSARVERKYAFPSHGAQAILGWLEHSCIADPLYPGGTVSTIYYDTPGLTAYREKRDGDSLKCKLRLRWYTAPGPAHAEGTVSCYLEAKRREDVARGRALRESRGAEDEQDDQDEDRGDDTRPTAPKHVRHDTTESP